MDDLAVLGAPIYTPTEVARLVKLHPTRVRRWLYGYSYHYQDQHRQQRPVLRRSETDPERYASFLDLMEIRIARQFIKQGFSPQRVRAAFTEAAEVTNQDHPFARRVFYTLGKSIYLQIRNQAGVENLLQLFTSGQWAIGDLILQDADRIDFDPQSQFARRWWPLGKDQPVVIDPAISFGAATLARRGVKTLNVYRTYMDEGGRVTAVARWLGIETAEVRAAVRWEKYRLSSAA